MGVTLKSWRQSASLILAAKACFAQTKKSDVYNYRLLLIQRSIESGFMPDTSVFPGGTISEFDHSGEWLELYRNFGFSEDKMWTLQNDHKIKTPRNKLPRFAALRIAALRETFEECGVLICRNCRTKYRNRISNWASFVGGYELKSWQDRVHDDPGEFLNLCLTYQIYPDLWALKEWSKWLTPPCMPTKYDTIFFIAILDQMPPVYGEEKEVQRIQWGTPKFFLMSNVHGDVLLPPPQFYEISRIATFTDIEALATFAGKRAACGIEQYWPYRIKTEKGLYTILPGDSLYPKSIDPNDSRVPYIDELPKSLVKNRILHKKSFRNVLEINNFKPQCNHVVPINQYI